MEKLLYFFNIFLIFQEQRVQDHKCHIHKAEEDQQRRRDDKYGLAHFLETLASGKIIKPVLTNGYHNWFTGIGEGRRERKVDSFPKLIYYNIMSIPN